MSMVSDRIRKEFHEMDTARDAGLTSPEDIVRYDDIVYGLDKRWQVLDVYRPKVAKETMLPVIVNVHGGGWVYGDKEAYQFYCMSLAQRGFAVVNFTYRLAPEHPYPASLNDTNLVFHWVYEHAADYGFDRENVFAVGDSAGANTLGLYAAICTNAAYAGQYDFHVPEKITLKAIALNCGLYKAKLDGEELTVSLMADYLPKKGTEEELRAIDVTAHVTDKFPPVFLLTCPGDFLKGQALLLTERLMECNVPFLYRYFVDAEKELGHVFHCNIRLASAAQCNDEECVFFRKYLREHMR